jgi:polyphosphate kinase
MEELVRREIEHHKAGRPAYILFKMNALSDPQMIRELYDASQAGLRADLLVRGVCCLRPGLPGISDRITVTSIVGRFLEHSRMYYFRNGGDEELYIGSADMMGRNINRRVEVLTPVESPELVRQIRDTLFLYLADNVKARVMQADGSYVRVKAGEQKLNAQEWLVQKARLSKHSVK